MSFNLRARSPYTLTSFKKLYLPAQAAFGYAPIRLTHQRRRQSRHAQPRQHLRHRALRPVSPAAVQFPAEIARIRETHALHQRHAKHPPILCIPCALHHAHAADPVIREQQFAFLLMQDAFPVDNRHLCLDADAAQPLD